MAFSSSLAPAPAPDLEDDNNEDDGATFTDESLRSITFKTSAPSPSSAKKATPTKPNPFQRVPNWLVDDEWDGLVFQTLLAKVFFAKAPDRVRSAARAASAYAGRENRYLANLTHEFDLNEVRECDDRITS